MKRRPAMSLLRLTATLAGLLLALTLTGSATAAPSGNAFLMSPYYGTTAITQYYNPPGKYHPAYDYGLRYNQVLAAASGTAEVVRWYDNSYECHEPVKPVKCGYGLHVIIRHANNYATIYGHLSSTAFELNTTTAAVTGGTIIGTSGTTGNSSGPHLHFEVDDANGSDVDPYSAGLWKDGEPVGHPIPRPATSSQIVVDDTTDNSAGFSKGAGGVFNNPCTGDCLNWTRFLWGWNGDMYRTLVNGSVVDNWSKWVPTIYQPGNYEVFIHTPPEHATSWQAPFRVAYTAGEARGVVDQKGLGETAESEWVSLAIYGMTGGNYVYMTDASGEGVSYHCGDGQYCELGADAVKLEGRSTVYQAQWRGDQAWSMNVAIIDNTPQLGSPSPPVGSGGPNLSYLPGSGALQTESYPVIGSTLNHYLWRGNQGWSRSMPIVYGQVQWSNASAWSGPYNVNVLPGSGDMQTQSDYVIGGHLWQTHWRGNGGWYRTVPIVNGTPDWSHPNPWNQSPLNLGQIACSEAIVAQTDYVVASTLYQSHWCLNTQGALESKQRTAPIANGMPQWASATAWETGTTGDLPGSGTLQARSDFALP